MKKLLKILAILGVIGFIASLFIPTVTIYANGIPAPDKDGSRDPHNHIYNPLTKETLTVCYDLEPVACE